MGLADNYFLILAASFVVAIVLPFIAAVIKMIAGEGTITEYTLLIAFIAIVIFAVVVMIPVGIGIIVSVAVINFLGPSLWPTFQNIYNNFILGIMQILFSLFGITLTPLGETFVPIDPLDVILSWLVVIIGIQQLLLILLSLNDPSQMTDLIAFVEAMRTLSVQQLPAVDYFKDKIAVFLLDFRMSFLSF